MYVCMYVRVCREEMGKGENVPTLNSNIIQEVFLLLLEGEYYRVPDNIGKMCMSGLYFWNFSNFPWSPPPPHLLGTLIEFITEYDKTIAGHIAVKTTIPKKEKMIVVKQIKHRNLKAFLNTSENWTDFGKEFSL